MWDSVVDVVMCLNKLKARFQGICRRSKMLIISTNLLFVKNYQNLPASVYVLLCLCVSENQPLIITAANHLHNACTSLLILYLFGYKPHDFYTNPQSVWANLKP